MLTSLLIKSELKKKMGRRLSKYQFSQKFVIMILFIYALDFIMDGKLSELFYLNPAQVVGDLEAWRLFTFPLAPGHIENVFLFGVTFTILGPKIESVIEGIYYPIILFLMACLLGTVITLGFWGDSLIFTGMTGLSFFVMSLFLYLNAEKKIIVLNSRPVRSFILVSLILLSWISSIVIRALLTNTVFLISELSLAGFGIISASLIYLQIYLVKRKKRGVGSEFDGLDIPDPEQLSMALISQQEQKKYNRGESDENIVQENEPVLNEDRLNQILDKINETGKESLSPEEIRFLKDYSKNL